MEEAEAREIARLAARARQTGGSRKAREACCEGLSVRDPGLKGLRGDGS
jgi:hypothetical protein